jgi:hypothetical protein
MANPNKAFLTGTDAVMQWYDTNAKTTFWSVNDSKGDILFYYGGNDENEAREHLENNLRMAEQQGVEATLTLRIHPKMPKSGYFEKKDTGMVVTHFRPTSFNPISYQPMNQMGMVNPNLMNEISALRSEIAALKMQQEIDDQDDDDEEPEENFLSGLMKSPQVQTMILSQLSSLFAPQQKVTHVAGIEKPETMTNETEIQSEIDNEERIYEAVEKLKLVDDQLASDLELLCEMAETDKMQFNFLLKMLRK